MANKHPNRFLERGGFPKRKAVFHVGTFNLLLGSGDFPSNHAEGGLPDNESSLPTPSRGSPSFCLSVLKPPTAPPLRDRTQLERR